MTIRDQWRRTVLPGLRGSVLDVGAGTGQALAHLNGCVVSCLEPRPSSRLRQAAAAGGARIIAAPAEHIPVADESFDVVICSAVLCSVRDQDRSLRELGRVLRPDGVLEFCEHVGSEHGSWNHRLQRMIAPFSKLLDGGCDPSRDTVAALERSPFMIDKLDRRCVRGPFGLETVHIQGRARIRSVV